MAFLQNLRLFKHAVLCVFALHLFVPACLLAQSSPPAHSPQHPQWILPNLHRRTVVAPPGASIQLTHVEAIIEVIDQIATTTLTLTMHNPGSVASEAVMVLPVANGTVVRSMQYDGVGPEPVASLLPKEKAREIYDAIVRASRDPALVEFIGLNLIQTSAFPIPPRTSQKLTLTLEQALIPDAGRLEYTLLRSNALATASTGWTIRGSVRASKPLSTIYSPTHAVEIKSTSANNITFSIEGASAAAGSVRLCILNAPENTQAPSFTIFAYPQSVSTPQPGTPHTPATPIASQVPSGGFFMLLGNFPTVDAKSAKEIKREVTLVIDRSGSMRGEKIEQARKAAIEVLGALDDGEYFNIIDYSDSVRTFAPKPVEKSTSSLAEAKAYIQSIESNGGTNIHDALLAALSDPPPSNALPLTLFLTDGLATVGERDELRIRTAVIGANKYARRIFAFGVGLDVNTPLLTAISMATRGTCTFVLPDEDLEVKMSRVFRGLKGPRLETPELSILDSTGKVSTRVVHSCQPALIPDYFEGDQMMIVGRYTSEAPFTIRVNGRMKGEPVVFDVPFDPSTASVRNDYVSRIWATRRVAELIEIIRQSGAEGSEPIADDRLSELTQEIIALSTTYGILTEYTAFLAKEETQLHPGANQALNTTVGKSLKVRAQQVRSGSGAVNQEYNKQVMANIGQTSRDDKAAPGAMEILSAAAPTDTQSYIDENLQKVEVSTIRQIGARTFYFREGRWVDARIAQQASTKIDEEVTIGSEAYMNLAANLAVDGEAALLTQEGTLMLLSRGRQYLVKPAP